MNWETLARELTLVTPSKIVLLVMDGMGGLPLDGRTELESSRHPNLDGLARLGTAGLTDPVFRGITPGSGPAHLGLFGYDPLRYQLGRGILEALGSGVEVGPQDLVARGNFATLRDGLVTDRRAGRIPTSECERLCALLNDGLKEVDGFRVSLYPGKEHRFVVKFSGEGLDDRLTDADPQKDHEPPLPTKTLAPEAERASRATNAFIDKATRLLAKALPANTVLLRGFSKFPDIPSMIDLYKLKPAAIANYPMYKGLARLLGMEVLNVGSGTADLFDALEAHYNEYDFFYIHFKRTDSTGEDGNYQGKVAAIEEIDAFVPRLAALKADVLVVTSDHSTPALLKGHSWHPNPFLLISATALPDALSRFTERECGRGMLGRFESIYAMPLMLAHAGKLKKYGA